MVETQRTGIGVRRDVEVVAAIMCFALLLFFATLTLYGAGFQMEAAISETGTADAAEALFVRNNIAAGRATRYLGASSQQAAVHPRTVTKAAHVNKLPSARLEAVQPSAANLSVLQARASRLYASAWCEAVVLGFAAICLYVTAVVSVVSYVRQRRSSGKISQTRASSVWTLVENLPVGVVFVQNERLYMNRIAEEITGYSSSEIASLSIWFRLLYRDSSAEVEDLYKNDRMLGFPKASRVTIHAKDGGLKQVEFAACTNNGGEIWILRDVTEDCAANEKFRVLFEHSSDAHLLFDETGLIDCNNAALRFIKVADKSALLGKHPGTFSPPLQSDGSPSREKAMEWDRLARETGHARFEWLRLASDGEVFPVEVSLTQVPLNGKLVLLDVWHDLRQQKKADAKRVRSEMAMQEAQALAHIGSIEYNMTNAEAYWSAEAMRLFGIETANIPSSPDKIRNLINVESTGLFLSALKSVMHSGDDTTVQVLPSSTDSGTRYLNLLLRCEKNLVGEPIRVIITAIDVTDRHHYEESLRSALDAAAAANAQLEAEIQMVNNQSLELESQKHELETANQRLHDLASRDGLTGLFNHRTFQERLRAAMDEGAVSNAPVALILLDVDYFKRYNDQYGHPAGDEVLRRVATVLASVCTKNQIVARYGGEEFAVILPSTPLGEALAVAEQIRLAVQSSSATAVGVTVSLGVAVCGFNSSAAEQLIGEADTALYHSKHHGRNQSTCFRAEHSPVTGLPKAA